MAVCNTHPLLGVVTLRYLASGDTFASVAELFGIGAFTANEIISGEFWLVNI